MATSYRLANESDVLGISTVFADAYNDLYRKRGLLEAPVSPAPPNPVFAFQIRKEPHAFWVAEEEGRIIGYSDSFVRGSLWYFSWLFISPACQGRDVGRELLERTLGSWEGTKITNRATITFAFNPVSQFLYMKYGMYPREPAYYAEAPSRTVKEDGPSASELRFEELTSPRDGSEVLRRMDESVLGFSLGWHHEYFFESKSRCYLFKDGSNPVGYAYVRPNGAVGPVAVGDEEFMKPVLEAGLELSADQGVEKVRYYIPGSNVHAVELAIKHRMRIDPYVFMSTKPFARWENYVFHSAALM
jgi:ribosomal protein S18 acetylase RimI-like enzyme